MKDDDPLSSKRLTQKFSELQARFLQKNYSHKEAAKNISKSKIAVIRHAATTPSRIPAPRLGFKRSSPTSVLDLEIKDTEIFNGTTKELWKGFSYYEKTAARDGQLFTRQDDCIDSEESNRTAMMTREMFSYMLGDDDNVDDDTDISLISLFEEDGGQDCTKTNHVDGSSERISRQVEVSGNHNNEETTEVEHPVSKYVSLLRYARHCFMAAASGGSNRLKFVSVGAASSRESNSRIVDDTEEAAKAFSITEMVNNEVTLSLDKKDDDDEEDDCSKFIIQDNSETEWCLDTANSGPPTRTTVGKTPYKKRNVRIGVWGILVVIVALLAFVYQDFTGIGLKWGNSVQRMKSNKVFGIDKKRTKNPNNKNKNIKVERNGATVLQRAQVEATKDSYIPARTKKTATTKNLAKTRVEETTKKLELNRHEQMAKVASAFNSFTKRFNGIVNNRQGVQVIGRIDSSSRAIDKEHGWYTANAWKKIRYGVIAKLKKFIFFLFPLVARKTAYGEESDAG